MRYRRWSWVWFWLAFSPSAWPQDVLSPARFSDFGGALNNAAAATAIGPDESPDLQNVIVDEPQGSIKPRNGFTQCGKLPSGGIATYLHPYTKANGSIRLIVSDNTNYYETPDCITFTGISGTFSSTARPSMRTVRDVVFIVNGSTDAFTWDGSTRTILNGNAGTPNPAPPRCRYLEYYLDRVFCARTGAEPSAVYFSALTDSAGNILNPSTGSVSWPATNALYIDRDGGSPIYGLKAYRGKLYVFKNNGIWRVDFRNDFDITVIKTLASVGTRFNDAIVEEGGVIYFVGPDGIYAFNGDESIRISDKIQPTFDTIRQPTVNDSFKTWDTQSDFSVGNTTGTTVYVLAGSVILSTNSVSVTNGDFETGLLTPWQCVVTSSETSRDCYIQAQSANATLGDTAGSWHGLVRGADGGGTPYGEAQLRNGGNTTTLDTIEFGSTPSTITFNTTGQSTTTFMLKILVGDTYMLSSTFTAPSQVTLFGYRGYSGARIVLFDNVAGQSYQSTGTFTSEVYNTVTVSSWSTFESVYATNGGAIDYTIRYGSDTASVLAASFTAINSGNLINAATWQTFIQWRATFTAQTDLTTTPELKSVTITYSQGDVNSSPIYGLAWRNRYWISAATGTSSTSNIALVRSKYKKDAWMPMDLKIGPMVNYNDRFYAAASTHSALYRMDFGTNDNGAAIQWFWTSRSETWGNPYVKKTLFETNAEFKKGTAEVVKLGYSRDYGNNWTEKQINMSGTGFGTAKQNVNGGLSPEFRFRVYSSSADASAEIIGISGWAIPERLRQ